MTTVGKKEGATKGPQRPNICSCYISPDEFSQQIFDQKKKRETRISLFNKLYQKINIKMKFMPNKQT